MNMQLKLKLLYFIFAGCLCGLPAGSHARLVRSERLLSFEEKEIPAYVTASKSEIALSGSHYKDGAASLRWSFEPGGTLSVRKNLFFEKKDPAGIDLYLSTFVVWIYNETPSGESIRFEFLKNGRVCCSFPFRIGFSGWRTAWVCYERDMEGTPEEGMDELRIVAPPVKGTLFIDHLLTAAKTDPRHQTADVQVPFVNKESDNHWLVVYRHSLLRPDIPLTPVTDKQKQETALIERRFCELIYTPSELTGKRKNELRRKYRAYRIVRRDGQVSGLPVFYTRASEAYERLVPGWRKELFREAGMEVKAYFDLMYKIAAAYRDASSEADKNELKEMFLDMYDHITDQGVAYGSCWGNFTHYGYSFRNFYTAYFLMKPVLAAAGKAEEAARAMRWYAIANEVFTPPLAPGIDMDSFNTQTTGRIAGILMMEDSPEKLQYLRSFARWIDNGCLPAPGLAGAFKKDGGAFHHRNHYPAYAVGGLQGAVNMIYLLNRTEFAVSETAHRTVRNVLLTMRFCCNTLHFPLSMSGRHPNGQGKLVPYQYALLAVSGTPDGKCDTDPELAAAYLRLAEKGADIPAGPEYMPSVPGGYEKQLGARLRSAGYAAEPEPQGNRALGYGCVSVQRRGNWSAVVRGHSRYLWASEHYIADNFYGRYLAHGSMQVLTAPAGATVTPATSGWQEEGFDWGRIPGATAIHLPVAELRADVRNVDAFSGVEEMLYSDEAFAGGLSQGGENGNFGMKLHEHDKYNGSHRARKSFHFFDGTIVCLGSDIENTNGAYPTETTVFQLTAGSQQEQAYWNRQPAGGKLWLDPFGTGYYTPGTVKLERNFPQYSLGEKTGKETEGDWVSLVFDHGKAPRGAKYEYAVLPQTDGARLSAFARRPPYRVLQRDKQAHIVRYLPEAITSYVLFETPRRLPSGLVLQADTSCLLMVREEPAAVRLTVCQPDLALYRGPSDELLDAAGKRVERSIYSRPWIDNVSGMIPVTVTLRGEWTVAEPAAGCRILAADKNRTVLRFECRDGASYEVRLTAKGHTD